MISFHLAALAQRDADIAGHGILQSFERHDLFQSTERLADLTQMVGCVHHDG
jgi:hypothetical protein